MTTLLFFCVGVGLGVRWLLTGGNKLVYCCACVCVDASLEGD